jgi:4-amino-4-deoxy-L-arabinose transferase-like glycosyltransferase
VSLRVAHIEVPQAPRISWPALASIAALLLAIAARIAGPSDIWDRSQPKTISYTTDIIVNDGDHWILPIERGEAPATKPPLYNWIAVPFVNWMGFSSELAHKFPSIIALCLTWLTVVRVGRRIDTGPDQALGWIAGMAVVANHTMFKLGYLARPDMLLTLWLTLAWVTATQVLAHGRNDRESLNCRKHHLTALTFWLCAALAGLTKGPAALIAIAYALLAARMIGGSWRAFGLLQPQFGLPLFLLINGAWVYGVWRIDPEHLTHTLIADELFGRVTGHMAEQDLDGWRGWLATMPYYVLYYFVRFLPWSAISIAAIVMLWRGDTGSKWSVPENAHETAGIDHRSTPQEGLRHWLMGAALQVVLVIAFFTLSTGKRADYIAAAFPPGALLAAWLLRRPPWLGVGYPMIAPGLATLTLLAVMTINQRQPSAPYPEYGQYMRRFIDETAQTLAAERRPVAFYFTGQTHVQAMLGYSMKEDVRRIDRLIKRGRPFWVIAGRRGPYRDFAQWLQARSDQPIRIRARIDSVPLTWRSEMVEQFTLYRVDFPRRYQEDSSDVAPGS